MELILFVIFLVLSFILIALGLFKSEHSELSLIGFLFLFLLSLIIITNSVSYQVGTQTNVSYFYQAVHEPDTHIINYTTETSTDVYVTSPDNNSFTHTVGYWLAIVSVVGFIGVIVSLRKQNWGRDQ